MKYKWKTTNKKLFYFDQSILQIYRLYKFKLGVPVEVYLLQGFP
jgi:hypothetical protein